MHALTLTANEYGKEFTRTAKHTLPSGIQDGSFMDDIFRLLSIEEDGTLVFEEYDPSSYHTAVFLKRDTPRVDYTYKRLDSSWNDGKWKLADKNKVTAKKENQDYDIQIDFDHVPTVPLIEDSHTYTMQHLISEQASFTEFRKPKGYN